MLPTYCVQGIERFPHQGLGWVWTQSLTISPTDLANATGVLRGDQRSQAPTMSAQGHNPKNTLKNIPDYDPLKPRREKQSKPREVGVSTA